jgi:hypothetical protein
MVQYISIQYLQRLIANNFRNGDTIANHLNFLVFCIFCSIICINYKQLNEKPLIPSHLKMSLIIPEKNVHNIKFHCRHFRVCSVNEIFDVEIRVNIIAT